jgi:hypothetical protein
LITRFFAYGDGLNEYKDQVAPFIYKYTKKMNARFLENPEEVMQYRQRFKTTMEFVSRNFPWGFRKSLKGKTSPRARFESIAIGSYLAWKEDVSILDKVISVEEWLDNKEFKAVTGADGANAISRLKTRINFVRDNLLGKFGQ